LLKEKRVQKANNINSTTTRSLGIRKVTEFRNKKKSGN